MSLSLDASLCAPLPAADALFLASARLGQCEEVSQMLVSGDVSIEARGVFGSALIEACRSDKCSPFHVLTVQALLANKADARAQDAWGASPLIHAAVRCSVLSERHLSRAIPAPGVAAGRVRRTTRQSLKLLPGTSAAAAAAAAAATTAGASIEAAADPEGAFCGSAAGGTGAQRLSHSALVRTGEQVAAALPLDSNILVRVRLEQIADAVLALPEASTATASAASASGGGGGVSRRASVANATESGNVAGAGDRSDDDGGGDRVTVSLCRPRFAEDGSARHHQLCLILANNPNCDVLHRTHNGVSAPMILAAAPHSDSLTLLEWILEKCGYVSEETKMKRKGAAAAALAVPTGQAPIWEPDAAGAHIVRVLLALCLAFSPPPALDSTLSLHGASDKISAPSRPHTLLLYAIVAMLAGSLHGVRCQRCCAQAAHACVRRRSAAQLATQPRPLRPLAAGRAVSVQRGDHHAGAARAHATKERRVE